jgi:hypothetical protein
MMKLKTILLFSFLFIFKSATLFAQAPQSFNYQAIARNGSGTILSNQNVSFRISILQTSITGTSVYSETHAVLTNQTGIVNFAIGNGVVGSGNFNSINWASGPYFIKVELDANGGSNYVVMSTAQLLSVPYSLYSNKSNEGANLKTLIYSGF